MATIETGVSLILSFNDLNWLAILVAAVAFFALGASWYQPKVMGNKWMKAAGVDPSEASPNPWIFVGTLIAYFLMAMVLAVIAQGIGASSVGDGLVLGLFTGVVFVGAQALGQRHLRGQNTGSGAGEWGSRRSRPRDHGNHCLSVDMSPSPKG